jgi:hypothetical protein
MSCGDAARQQESIWLASVYVLCESERNEINGHNTCLF